MPLTTEEQAQLMRLQEKAAEPSEPLSDDDLIQMEKTAAEVYEQNAELFRKNVGEVWNNYCRVLGRLSDDNIKLIAEIRRLKTS